MASFSGLPDNESSWQAAWNGASDTKASEQTLASKITFKQFLQLQVLWKLRNINFFLKNKKRFDVSDHDLGTASNRLNGLTSWVEYLDYLNTFGTQPGPLSERLGVFALVLVHQKEVRRKVKDESEQVVYGEARYQLRPRAPVRPEPESPTRILFTQKNGNDPATPVASITKYFGVLSLDESPFSPRTPFAQSGALTEEMFPRAPDEQIVNTALIDFLEAISIHFPCRAEWTLHRRAFHIGDFEARVDGYLKIAGTDIVKAIVK